MIFIQGNLYSICHNQRRKIVCITNLEIWSEARTNPKSSQPRSYFCLNCKNSKLFFFLDYVDCYHCITPTRKIYRFLYSGQIIWIDSEFVDVEWFSPYEKQ